MELRPEVAEDLTYSRDVKTLWTKREIDAPAEVLWRLLTDPQQWPKWGPTVRSAELDNDHFAAGATGTVATPIGAKLNFEITECVEGESWVWKVAGIPATHHTVESISADRCRVGFGVPWVAAPYLAACQVALRRLESLAVTEGADPQVAR